MRFQPSIEVSLLLISSCTGQNTVNIDYNMQFGIMDLFQWFFPDPMLGMQLLNHGCWCAKLHPMADLQALGGPYHADEVDRLCKEWMKERRCSRRDGRICENTTFVGTEYQVEYDITSFDARCPDNDECLSLTCQMDMFYINALLNATQDIFGFTANLNPACEVSQKHGGVPDCEDFTTTEFFLPTTIPTTQAPTTLENPREVLCRQDPMDLVFVVDGSTSTGMANFDKQIQFMKNLVDVMTVGTNDTRIAMVQFSDGPATLEFGFIDDETDLEIAFDGVTYLTGGTHTGAAIQFAHDNVITPGARSDVRVVMVILTDGSSFDDVVTPSDNLRAVGVDVFAVGYATANPTQLQAIANDPDSEFVYQGATMDDILVIVDELVTEVCSQPMSFTG